MQIPSKKLKNGFEIPVLGFGTWKMGWTTTRDKKNDDESDIQAIRYAISQWLTCIDSAEMYAGWYSETLLWQAISHVEREELFISSKVRWDNCSYTAIKNACQNSLNRLWVEYLDLYYIHWRDEQFSLKDAMKAMNELVDEWYIRYIGVSNFSVKSLKEAQKHSEYPIVANQVHLNLKYREPIESWLLEYCQNNDVMIVAWRPFEYWDFLTKEVEKILHPLAEKYNKTYFQIALNWIIHHQSVVTLFMSRKQENITENLWSLDWKMSEKDYNYLTKNFPHQEIISNAVPLK